MAASVLLCGLSLTACASPEPIVTTEYVRPVIPPQLRDCAAEPPPPEDITDRAVALWLLDLVAAGADCRHRLAALVEAVE